MKISLLTTAEEHLMKVLWNLDSAYMREIIEQYPEPKPHPNTISTFLKILVEKEFLTTEKEGRIFRYSVAVPFNDYKKFMLTNFLDQYFNNSAREMIEMMRDEKLLQATDLEDFFETKSTIIQNDKNAESESDISQFIEDITGPKKKKKKKNRLNFDHAVTVKKKKKKNKEK